MSKKIQKLNAKIAAITAKGASASSWEKLNLFYAKMQIENKSASGIYKALFEKASPELSELLRESMGGNYKPEFKTFLAALKPKEYYSLWDGVLACQSFNKAAINAAKLAAKVAKQGGTME
jgi:hypothetical protein